MKTRFITAIVVSMLISRVSFAGVPTADVLNLGPNVLENIQTTLSKVENSQQVVTIQATLSKIGSVKNSVSDFINKQKDVIKKYREKMETYIEEGKKYAEKVKAYAAVAVTVIGVAQSIKENGLDGYLKENAGNIVGDAAKSLGIKDGDKLANIADKAANGDLEGLGKDALGNITTRAGIDTGMVEGAIDQVANGGLNDLGKDVLGNIATRAGIDTGMVEGAIDQVANGGLNDLGKDVLGNIATRAGIDTGMIEGAIDQVANGGLNDLGKDVLGNIGASTGIDTDKIEGSVNNVSGDDIKGSSGDTSSSEGLSVNRRAFIKESSEPLSINSEPKDVSKSFNSSYGYGKIHNKHQLGFANIDSGSKTGQTAEGILIVPESISLNCDVNYEQAIEPGKMDECLKKINTIANSEVTEEIPKGVIDEAAKDIYNGYVEYLTASYFEALSDYNDTLLFKSNQLDPIATTTTSDVDSAWRVAKEMHLVLGERINNLRKLWARNLSMKMYKKYVTSRFANKQE